MESSYYDKFLNLILKEKDGTITAAGHEFLNDTKNKHSFLNKFYEDIKNGKEGEYQEILDKLKSEFPITSTIEYDCSIRFLGTYKRERSDG